MTCADDDITVLLRSLSDRSHGGIDAAMPHVYEQLRRLARARLRSERTDHTLNTTALVHEAYLKLARVRRVQWRDRAHFFGVASAIMRKVLIDYANRRNALKRSGGEPVQCEESAEAQDEVSGIMVALNAALERLEEVAPRQARVIEHRYFGGLTLEETAEALGLSLATVKRDLRFAQAWLAREIGAGCAR